MQTPLISNNNSDFCAPSELWCDESDNYTTVNGKIFDPFDIRYTPCIVLCTNVGVAIGGAVFSCISAFGGQFGQHSCDCNEGTMGNGVAGLMFSIAAFAMSCRSCCDVGTYYHANRYRCITSITFCLSLISIAIAISGIVMNSGQCYPVGCECDTRFCG